MKLKVRAEVKAQDMDGHVEHPVLMQRIGSHVLSQSNSIVLDLNFFLELVNFVARMDVNECVELPLSFTSRWKVFFGQRCVLPLKKKVDLLQIAVFQEHVVKRFCHAINPIS